ncbi:MAG: hypothetical protein ACJ71J_11970 [Nitrososphaeraceae archaeon]
MSNEMQPAIVNGAMVNAAKTTRIMVSDRSSSSPLTHSPPHCRG